MAQTKTDNSLVAKIHIHRLTSLCTASYVSDDNYLVGMCSNMVSSAHRQQGLTVALCEPIVSATAP
jgi:hypothetical protein